jgi:pyrroline-5-carboxylate reductase
MAERFARATVEGAAELMFRTPGTDLGALREAVTSPGGTTEAALGVLMGADGLQRLLTAAVEAAVRRSAALAG